MPRIVIPMPESISNSLIPNAPQSHIKAACSRLLDTSDVKNFVTHNIKIQYNNNYQDDEDAEKCNALFAQLKHVLGDFKYPSSIPMFENRIFLLNTQ